MEGGKLFKGEMKDHGRWFKIEIAIKGIGRYIRSSFFLFFFLFIGKNAIILKIYGRGTPKYAQSIHIASKGKQKERATNHHPNKTEALKT